MEFRSRIPILVSRMERLIENKKAALRLIWEIQYEFIIGLTVV